MSSGTLGHLADLVVTIHLGYLLFTVGGELLIVIGGFAHWEWVRNRVFRIVHLVAVVFVAFEAIVGMMCPLTVLEYRLRIAAGQHVEGDISLVGRIIHSIMFYDFPAWFFTMLYVGFGALVAGTLLFVPPRWKGRVRSQSSDR